MGWGVWPKTCWFSFHTKVECMDFIVLAALIVEVAVSRLENRFSDTRITPFGVLAFPYALP
jgi:hypothetical protein